MKRKISYVIFFLASLLIISNLAITISNSSTGHNTEPLASVSDVELNTEPESSESDVEINTESESSDTGCVCFTKSVCGSTTITQKTKTVWTVVIKLTNNFQGPICGAVVKDRLGAELEIYEPWRIPWITPGTFVSFTTRGKSKKVFLTWEIGDLNPGEEAKLVFYISTDLNPAGKQEYTSPGCYELNSGATLKYIYEGVQFSEETGSIYITVLP